MSVASRIHVAVLALPLGNPEDISLRGKKTFEEADRLFCEDSRKLHALLQALGIRLKEGCRVTSLPGNEEWNFNWKYIEDDALQFQEPYCVVLVSDAGTPGLNDPGRALAEHALKQGWNLKALPGPSAPVLALQWTGGFGLPFLFVGFVPKARGKSWREFLSALRVSGTLACFETRHQIVDTLEALMASGHAETRLHLCREMTKTHEELWSGSVCDVLEVVKSKLERDDAIGEITLLFEGQGALASEANTSVSPEELAQKILGMQQLPPKAASKVLAELTGLDKGEAYRLMAQSKGAKETKK
jgi:16S rRNA (cytidine1402-2'-O)-methyltransferase